MKLALLAAAIGTAGMLLAAGMATSQQASSGKAPAHGDEDWVSSLTPPARRVDLRRVGTREAAHVATETWEYGWQWRAVCRGEGASLFFAPNHFEPKDEKRARERKARAICGRCPVRAGGGEGLAVGGDADALDPVGVAPQDEEQFRGPHVPDPGGVIAGSRRTSGEGRY